MADGLQATSLQQVERELARLRINPDGTLGTRASVLNLISVTDEASAGDVARAISGLSGHYPARAILIISDPDEGEANLEIKLSTICRARGAGGNQVCAEQITVHVEGPPANHLESLAGPLLIPDIPVFLWYPNGDLPSSPGCDGMATLANRLILDSGMADDCEALLRGAADLLGERDVPALGDLRWVAFSPWRSLFADLFASPERAAELGRIELAEIAHSEGGECQALLCAGWLSGALGWRPESVERTQKGRAFGFAGGVTVELVPSTGGPPLSRIRLHAGDITFEVSRCAEHADAYSSVKRGDEILAERAARLGPSGTGVLLGEELKFLGRDETYEAALIRAVELLDL